MLPEMYNGGSFSLGIIVLRSRWVASVVKVLGQGWGRVVSSVTVDHCWKSTVCLETRSGFLLTSVQFKVVTFCSENPSYAPPGLSDVPPLPLKQFQCLSD